MSPVEPGVARSTPGERSIFGVLHDIVGNVQDIFRSEFDLARAEIKAEAASAVRPIALLGVGAVLAVHAAGLVLLALVFVLSMYVPFWVAALAVGGGTAILAVVLMRLGARGLSQVKVTPERTLNSLKESTKWATT